MSCQGAIQRHDSIHSNRSGASSAISTAQNSEDNEAPGKGKKTCLRKPFLFTVLSFNAPEWYFILLGGIASLLFGAVTPVYTVIFSRILGVFAEPDASKAEEQARNFAIIILCIGIAGGLCQLASSTAFAYSGEALTWRMRIKTFKAILRQEISWFEHESNRLETLVTRLATDASALKGMTGVTIGTFLNAIGTAVAGLVVAFTAGWKLTLVLLCFTPLIVIAGIVQGATLAKASQQRQVSSYAETGSKVSCIDS